MKRHPTLVATILLIAAILVACGPSEEEQNATATAEAAALFATQTAEAPTSTPTPEPTDTPTPEPTATPEAEATEAPDESASANSELATALLTLEDLPEGFQQLPTGLMDQQLGEGALEAVGPNAIFMSFATGEMAMSILTPLTSEFERSLFVEQLEDPEALAEMMGLEMQLGAAGEPEIEFEEFEVEGIGESATGIRTTISLEGATFAYDVMVFNRGDVSAVVGVMHAEGLDSQVDIMELAQTVDGRLMALSE